MHISNFGIEISGQEIHKIFLTENIVFCHQSLGMMALLPSLTATWPGLAAWPVLATVRPPGHQAAWPGLATMADLAIVREVTTRRRRRRSNMVGEGGMGIGRQWQ